MEFVIGDLETFVPLNLKEFIRNSKLLKGDLLCFFIFPILQSFICVLVHVKDLES